jgi:hypothetical protein
MFAVADWPVHLGILIIYWLKKMIALDGTFRIQCEQCLANSELC